MVSPFSFSIGDTTELEPYLHGGIAVQVKTPKTFCFVSIFFFCFKYISLQKNGRREKSNKIVNQTVNLGAEQIFGF